MNEDYTKIFNTDYDICKH